MFPPTMDPLAELRPLLYQNPSPYTGSPYEFFPAPDLNIGSFLGLQEPTASMVNMTVGPIVQTILGPPELRNRIQAQFMPTHSLFEHQLRRWRRETMFQIPQEVRNLDYLQRMRLFRGLVQMTGGRWTRETADMAYLAARDFDALAPYIMTAAPWLHDALHASRGSAEMLYRRLAAGGQYRHDPTTSIMGMSREAVERLTSEIVRMMDSEEGRARTRWMGTGELGAMFEEAQRRGWMQPMPTRGRAILDMAEEQARIRTGGKATRMQEAFKETLTSFLSLSDPELDAIIHKFDSNRTIQRLSDLSGVVSALKEVLGPDAPMFEIFETLSVMTQGQFLRMSPERAEAVVRDVVNAAKATGQSLPHFLGSMSVLSRMAAAEGTSPFFIPHIRTQAALYAQAHRAEVASPIEKQVLEMSDLQLRQGALKSTYYQRAAALMRLYKDFQLGEGTEAHAMLEAFRKGQMTYKFEGQTRNVLDISNLARAVRSSGKVEAGTFNMILADHAENMRRMEYYDPMGDFVMATRRAQIEEAKTRFSNEIERTIQGAEVLFGKDEAYRQQLAATIAEFIVNLPDTRLITDPGRKADAVQRLQQHIHDRGFDKTKFTPEAVTDLLTRTETALGHITQMHGYQNVDHLLAMTSRRAMKRFEADRLQTRVTGILQSALSGVGMENALARVADAIIAADETTTPMDLLRTFAGQVALKPEQVKRLQEAEKEIKETIKHYTGVDYQQFERVQTLLKQLRPFQEATTESKRELELRLLSAGQDIYPELDQRRKESLRGLAEQALYHQGVVRGHKENMESLAAGRNVSVQALLSSLAPTREVVTQARQLRGEIEESFRQEKEIQSQIEKISQEHNLILQKGEDGRIVGVSGWNEQHADQALKARKLIEQLSAVRARREDREKKLKRIADIQAGGNVRRVLVAEPSESARKSARAHVERKIALARNLLEARNEKEREEIKKGMQAIDNTLAELVEQEQVPLIGLLGDAKSIQGANFIISKIQEIDARLKGNISEEEKDRLMQQKAALLHAVTLDTSTDALRWLESKITAHEYMFGTKEVDLSAKERGKIEAARESATRSENEYWSLQEKIGELLQGREATLDELLGAAKKLQGRWEYANIDPVVKFIEKNKAGTEKIWNELKEIAGRNNVPVEELVTSFFDMARIAQAQVERMQEYVPPQFRQGPYKVLAQSLGEEAAKILADADRLQGAKALPRMWDLVRQVIRPSSEAQLIEMIGEEGISAAAGVLGVGRELSALAKRKGTTVEALLKSEDDDVRKLLEQAKKDFSVLGDLLAGKRRPTATEDEAARARLAEAIRIIKQDPNAAIMGLVGTLSPILEEGKPEEDATNIAKLTAEQARYTLLALEEVKRHIPDPQRKKDISQVLEYARTAKLSEIGESSRWAFQHLTRGGDSSLAALSRRGRITMDQLVEALGEGVPKIRPEMLAPSTQEKEQPPAKAEEKPGQQRASSSPSEIVISGTLSFVDNERVRIAGSGRLHQHF